MKTTKKLLAIALVLLMMLSLSACSMDTELADAFVKLQAFKSVHADFEGIANISMGDAASGMELSASTHGTMNISKEPLCGTMDMTAGAMGEVFRILVYFEDRGEDFFVAFSMDGGENWETEELDKSEIGPMNQEGLQLEDMSLEKMLELAEQAGEVFSGFDQAGTETIDGVEFKRYDGSMHWDALYAVAQTAGAEELTEEIPFDLSSLKDIQISLWVDAASGVLTRMKVDLTDAMQSLIESPELGGMAESMTGGASVAVKEISFIVTYSDFDQATVTAPAGLTGAAPAIEPAGGPVLSKAEPAPVSLVPGSEWEGTMELHGVSGKGELKEGVIPVDAVLDSSDDGQLYFEIYDSEGVYFEEDRPILSYWAQIDGDSIVPVIGEEDAWLLSIYLNPDDTDAISFKLQGATLSADYFYYDDYVPEACDVSFRLNPAD